MATSGDVTVAQNGGQGNVKIHPYLVTLVRWCMSCVWSTATVFLHRLLTTPLQPITGPKPAPARGKLPKRAAGTEHLHPEPRVSCQLLHHPAVHTMDVIFVHGLYGSLGNTWRQGDWRQKYLADPKIVTLRDHSKPNTCNCQRNSFENDTHNANKCNNTSITENSNTNHIFKENTRDNTEGANNFTNQMYNENKYNDRNVTDLNDPEMTYKRINEKLSKKIIPEQNDLITEQFYNNTLKDQVNIVENYDTQAKFVRDMFKKETDCDISCDTFKYSKEDNRLRRENDNDYFNENTFKYNEDNEFKCDRNSDNDFKCDDTSNYKYDEGDEFKCKYNEINDFNECKCVEKKCEVGCGCICNDCYSSCWPKDWIQKDFPGARVISINYTSDPYLWRPLWIKENKRLNLYQRAEQMIEQLLDMGVGEKPIVWVGHSKGGLFIKQIYCEAYEAYMKTNENIRTKQDVTKEPDHEKIETSPETRNGITAENIDTIIGHFSREVKNNNTMKENDSNIDNDNYTKHTNNCTKDSTDNYTRENHIYRRNGSNIVNNNSCVINETVEYENVFEQLGAKNYNNCNSNVINDNIRNLRIENGDGTNKKKLKGADLENEDLASSVEAYLLRRSALWHSSRGFMFYSVPHRGSPLADIKTPVTARSVDLLEIAKDCPLVLELHARWELAVGPAGARAGPVGARAGPAVSSMVETCRTLMSVLWLRIVSTDSADAGIGRLSGISVDHREICKPTSRSCPLYTTLTDLIQEAMTCTCQ